MTNKEQYRLLSELFLYPKEGYKNKVRECMHYLGRFYPEAATSLKRFHETIVSKSLYEIEEIFGITFHIQSICFLDIGYVLFREDYSRGEFLRNMKNEQNAIGHNCGEELADNLPHVLQFMSKSQNHEFVEELAVKAVIPALEQMLGEFDSARRKLKKKVIKKKQKAIIMEDVADGNIYQNALQALFKVLHKDFEQALEPDAEPPYRSIPGVEMVDCGACSFTNSKTNKTV